MWSVIVSNTVTTRLLRRVGSRPEPIMPEMPVLSGKRKVPMLPSQGASSYYAKWGRWVDGFASCLTAFFFLVSWATSERWVRPVFCRRLAFW